MNIDVSEIISTIADNNNISNQEVFNLISHYERTLKKEMALANKEAEESFVNDGVFKMNTKIYIPNFGSFLSTRPRNKDIVKILAEKS